MERYYLVKTITTATVQNENFHGEEHLSFYGKGQKLLFSAGHKDGWGNFNMLSAYFMREYGYARKCDAARSWIYKNPHVDEPYWKTKVSIVEMWVKHDGTVTMIP